MNTQKQFTECPKPKGCHPFSNYGIGRKKLFIDIHVVEKKSEYRTIMQKVDDLSRYLFIACLIAMPIFLIYNLIKL
jgi:hypothetical protein